MSYIGSSMRLALFLAAGSLASQANASGDGTGIWTDPAGDAAVRRTDVGNDGPLPSGFAPIDLLGVRLRGWASTAPTTDPYSGSEVTGDADLFRLDVVLDGLVCPPGPLGLGGHPYDPRRYGDRPLFGFIEFDVDDDVDSGGELTPVANQRYLANVGRFGRRPGGDLAGRIVENADDVNTNFNSAPYYERSGGEFSLTMCGCFAPTLVSQNGDMDGTFDAGETWVVSGRFFERFQSYKTASGFFGGSDFGFWDPIVRLRFQHDGTTDTTTVSLVYAITNSGAAQLAGDNSVEPVDFRVSNQTSVEEAISDLIDSIGFARDHVLTLSEAWYGRDYTDYGRPREWAVTALIGSTYTTAQSGAFFVWTDTGFDEMFGDLNNDGVLAGTDALIVENAILDEDGGADDADHTVNGAVAVPSFGPYFDLRDLSGDGVIDIADRWEIACVADVASPYGALNFFDVNRFLELYEDHSPLADINRDGIYNFFDFTAYFDAYEAGCP